MMTFLITPEFDLDCKEHLPPAENKKERKIEITFSRLDLVQTLQVSPKNFGRSVNGHF